MAQGIRVAVRSGDVPFANGQTVRIGDLADISGGSIVDRDRISQLDLETLRTSAQPCEISRKQIEMRILVDGYQRTQIGVTGPESILIRSTKPKQLLPHLEQDLESEIGRQFALDPKSVSVRLSNASQIASVQSRLGNQSFTTTVLLSAQLPMGQTPIEVEFTTDKGQRFVERFETQVIIEIQVALAKQPIQRGEVLSESMFDLVQRPIVQRADFAQQGHLIGRVAKRSIASNEVILRTYLADTVDRSEPVVKRNDLLDVIVPLGSSEVRLKNAKSLSTGDVGDTITVLNTRSNRQLSAIVVDRNLAKVLPLGRSVLR
ncbi:MAG: flagellar basal body P-ring formation chaperone FlgA [Pirellulaceae bacterium]